MEDKNSAFVNDDSIYNKKIQPVPKPEREIGIDTSNSFYDNIIVAAKEGEFYQDVDVGKIESFSNISESRDQVYTILDTMARDAKVSAILETYAADATEYNDEGKIVWAEATDANVASYVSYLIDTLQVDKHIYGWVYSLIKYGDAYFRMYRKSEYSNSILFDKDEQDEIDKIENGLERKSLNEDVKIKAFRKDDRLVHYLELVPNPAEVFELTKFGKTQAYIKTNLVVQQSSEQNPAMFGGYYRYSFRKDDVEIYQPTMFVHAFLEDTSTRTPELVEIFKNNNPDETSSNSKYEYRVRRGKSLLYDKYKLWRMLSLLDNSLLLNRLTKSAITRIIQVEVADMAKEDARKVLYGIKNQIEQKSALDVGNSMSEYTSPGPIENNVFLSTSNGHGAITAQTIGGDVNIRDIADIDYYVNLFYGSFGIPKAYFGFTDDGAGFNGGTSLSILSARYAKDVKKVQNAMLQALTTAINIMLIDKGMDSYVNEFKLRMLAPTTQEELDRRASTEVKLRILGDTIQNLGDIEDPVIKLKITKSLMANVTSNEEIIQLIDEQIRALEGGEEDETGEKTGDGSDAGETFGETEPLGLNRSALGELNSEEIESEETETTGEETILPTPNELGIDMTQNTEEQ